ncbi:MAG: Rrf2 family transcriptional regulator [Chloroflexi bacterium]|nr:Rrf2 family transcriptional regulator [Chloroflexota bacterium]
MKISTRTEYGIRVLVTLARTDEDPCLSLAEIARREKLPHAYLEQLVGALRRAGLVTSTRGVTGGYRLARPAADIAMTDAVRALDGPLLEMPCAGAEDLEHCDRPQPCSVHEIFQRVYESLSASLGSTTLAEVAATPGGPPYPVEVRRRRAAAHASTTQTPPQQQARNA